MPYPILTLPYPFAKRLRHLLNPSELQELQIAAGHGVINTLKPRVPSFKAHGLYFYGTDETNPNAGPTCELFFVSFQNIYTAIIISKHDKCLIECEKIELCGMSNIAFKNLRLTNLLIKVPKIHVEESHVSNDFLKSLSTLTLKPSYLNIYDCRFDEDVTFSTILDIFPSVTTVYLNKVYFGWLNDLSSVKKSLQLVFIMHDNFEKMFSFQPEELYEFVANQGPEFRLLLRIESNGVDLTDKIQQYIDPRFKHGNFKNANFTVSISFAYSGPVLQTHYVVESLKRKREENNLPKNPTAKMPRKF